MILTGKAKKDFLNYVYGLGLQELLVYDVSYNSIVIEWLDSVGIYISIESVFDNMLGYHRGFQVQIYQDGKQPISIDKDNDVFESRQQATEDAIKQANLIYNNKLKKNEQPFKKIRKFPGTLRA